MSIKRRARAAALLALTLVVVGAVAGTARGGTNSWQDIWAQIKPLLADPGTINNADNPVNWTKLKRVPAGLADGLDNGVDKAGFGLKKNIYPDLEFAVDTSKIQQRVGGACDSGKAIQSINADGSVACSGSGSGGSLVVYQGSAASQFGQPVGNDWASIGGALDIPAGRWLLAGTVELKGNYDIEYAACQLEAWLEGVRYPRDKIYSVVGAPNGLDDSPAHVTTSLTGVWESSEPSRIAIVCKDDDHGVHWLNAKVTATRASEVHVQQLR
jgi:hypothetical protein